MLIIIIIRRRRMDQVKFVEDCLYKIWSGHFKFFKGCLTQILIGPLFNTLTQMIVSLTSFTNWLFIKFHSKLYFLFSFDSRVIWFFWFYQPPGFWYLQHQIKAFHVMIRSIYRLNSNVISHRKSSDEIARVKSVFVLRPLSFPSGGAKTLVLNTEV